MDHRGNLEVVGRLGRAARITAVICLLIACALLVSSLMSPTRVVADIQSTLHNPTPRIF
jgi:succinate dehydrogenase hydrophobic anchor subunit